MTVETSSNKSGPYALGGGVLRFRRDFRVYDEAHVRVVVLLDGVERDIDTGFTQNGIGEDEGEVIFLPGTVPPAGELFIIRAVPNVQPSDYSNQGRVAPARVERDFDLMEMQIQDLAEAVGRSLKVPISKPGVGVVVPGDGETLVWDEGNGSFIAGPNVSDIYGAVAAAESIREAVRMESQVFMATSGVTRYTHDRDGARLHVVEGRHQLFGPFGRMVLGDDYTVDGGDILFSGAVRGGDVFTLDHTQKFGAGEMQGVLDGLADAVRGADPVYPNRASAVAAIALLPLTVRRISWLDGFGVSSAYRSSSFFGIADMPGWKMEVNKVASFGGDVAAAHLADGGVVDYGDTYWDSDQASAYYNVYSSSRYRTAGKRLQAGRYSAPTSDARPILVIHKESSANRDEHPSEWDQSLYVSMSARSGGAYRAAGTAFTRVWADAGAIDGIGQHGRVDMRSPTARGYAGWFYYSELIEGANAVAGHALELNGNVRNDPGYGSKHQLLRLCMADRADSTNRFSSAIAIGRSTHGGDNGFYTGIHFEADSLIRRPSGQQGEAIKVNAPSVAGGAIGGFRFVRDAGDNGVFEYALKTDEAVFSNNNAINLGTGQHIRAGDPTNSERPRITGGGNNWAFGNAYLNITDPVGSSLTAVMVAGAQVLSTRKTGWTATTGGAVRGGWASATVTLPELADTMRALIADLRGHGLIGD